MGDAAQLRKEGYTVDAVFGAGLVVASTRELREETVQMSKKAQGIGKFPIALEQRDAETISEALADAYLEGAESSDDQTQVVLMQGWAERAIARLARLRSLTMA
jgi:hypothetical protein